MTTADERAIFGFTFVDWMLSTLQLIKMLGSNIYGNNDGVLTERILFTAKCPQTNHDRLTKTNNIIINCVCVCIVLPETILKLAKWKTVPFDSEQLYKQ